MILEEAIAKAFEMAGLSVLAQPRKLRSFVFDLCDDDSQEFRVFRNNCDEGFCAPFLDAAHQPSVQAHDLIVASQRAELYLRDDRMISADAARATSRCFARAMGTALNLPPTELSALSTREEVTAETTAKPVVETFAPQVVTPTQTQRHAPHTPTPAPVPTVPAPAPTAPVSQPKKESSLPTLMGIAVVAIAVVAAIAVTGGFSSSNTNSLSQASSNGEALTTESTVDVPATEGLTLDSARVNLESVGLRVQVAEEESDEAPQTVLRSEPAAGSKAQEGTTIKLVVAKARPQADSPVQQSTPAQQQPTSTPSEPASSSYGPASFSSTSYMNEVWDFFPYYDRTPQTIHSWMLANGFWVDSVSSDCAVYLSQYGTQFVFEQDMVSPENTAGFTSASSDEQSPLLGGMRWRVMRVHFWGEGLDYAIDKCHLSGENWRGTAGEMGTPSNAYMMVASDAPAARGSRDGYVWEASFDSGSKYCTVVVRVG